MPTRRSSTWSIRPDAVGAAERVEPLDELDRVQPLAVDRDRDPALELDRRSRPGGRVGRLDGPFVGVGRRRDPGVLEDAGLARAAPQVHVDRVRRRLRDRDLDPALDRRTRSPGRGTGPSRRASGRRPRAPVEGVDGDVEPDLVVALAGAAVGDRVGALALGDLDEQLGDQRPGQRRRERIDALVERVRLEMRPDEVRDEPLARVDHVGPRRAGAHRPALDALAQRAATDVDRQGHDLDVELLAQPGDGDRRIEPARVGEDDLLHGASLRWLCLTRHWIAWKPVAASARGAPRRRRARATCCRRPACPPARAASTRRSPGR